MRGLDGRLQTPQPGATLLPLGPVISLCQIFARYRTDPHGCGLSKESGAFIIGFSALVSEMRAFAPLNVRMTGWITEPGVR